MKDGAKNANHHEELKWKLKDLIITSITKQKAGVTLKEATTQNLDQSLECKARLHVMWRQWDLKDLRWWRRQDNGNREQVEVGMTRQKSRNLLK